MSTPRKDWQLTNWKGYGSPQWAAKQLRQAALDSDNLGHDCREVAFYRWRITEPVMAEAVLLWMHNAMEGAR